MSEEALLSNEETEALLDAMRRSEDDAPAVEGIDLTSPERRLRTALPIADKAGRVLEGLARRLVLRHAGAPSRAEAEPAEINPFSVVIGGVRPGSAIGRLSIGESFGFVIVGPQLVSFLLERQLGAPMSLDEEPELGSREELTLVDRRVLQPVLEEFAVGLSESWVGATDVIRLASVEGSVHSLPEIDPYAPVLRLGCQVTPRITPPDEVSIVFAASAVSSLFGETETERAHVSPTEKRRVRKRIDATHVEVRAILGAAETSIREVLELEIGDVIRLDAIPGRPCRVVANGVGVLRGNPVIHHGNLAIEITGDGR